MTKVSLLGATDNLDDIEQFLINSGFVIEHRDGRGLLATNPDDLTSEQIVQLENDLVSTSTARVNIRVLPDAPSVPQ